MAYQEVTKTSYGQNIGNSFKGIFTGILLVIAGTIAIFWNENRAIKTYKAINRTQDVCVEMPDINTVSADMNGKVVHATGIATTTETLTDSDFGVNVNAIALERKVEYYQWVEHSKSESKDKLGGGTETTTTYTYTKEWVSRPETGSFKDPNQETNTILLEIPEQDQLAENVTFGAYNLGKFAGSISGNEPAEIAMDSASLVSLNGLIKQRLGLPDTINANYVTVNGNTVYIGASPAMPAIGDARVTITYVPNNQEISLIAEVNGNTFASHVDKNGKEVSSLVMGNKTADQMFESLKESNKMWTWILRIIILLVIIGGFKSMVSIVPTLLKVLPFLGKGVGSILGFVCTILGFIWTLIFTAIAWIAVRPVLGISLLVVVVGLIVWLTMRSKKAEKEMPVEQQTEA